MRRRILNIAGAVSLALCTMTTMLWVRTRWTSDNLLRKSAQGPIILREFIASSDRGGLDLIVNVNLDLTSAYSSGGWTSFKLPGIRYAQWTASGGYHGQLNVSHWLAAAAMGVAPLSLVLLRVRAARARTPIGFCRTCGYDLRATPKRCAECGAVPDKAAA
jgi:hypothetical protein